MVNSLPPAPGLQEPPLSSQVPKLQVPKLRVPLESLPEEGRELLDSDHPLLSGHFFLPRDTGRVVPPAAKAAAAFGIGLVFASGLLRDEALVLKGIYGVVAALALVGGVAPAWRAVGALRRRWALRQGRWRRGLHVLPHALLQWDGANASWIPRECIESLRVFGRTGKSGFRRMTVVEMRGVGERTDEATASKPASKTASTIETLDLPEVPPLAVAEAGASPTLFGELAAWVESGEFRPPAPPPALSDLVRPWIRNILIGHGVMTLVGLAGLVLAVAVGQVLGRPFGTLLGLLLGVPVFLAFPALLHRLAGKRMAVDPRRGEIAGWGYQILLGLAALFIVIVGGETVETLWWQVRATVDPAATLASMTAAVGSPVFHRWPDDAVPSGSVLGHSTSRFFLGDSRWVKTTFYVAPLMGPRGPQLGCVWVGLETGEGLQSAASERRLLQQRADWLVEAAGVERSGYRAAVEDALDAGEIALGPCRVLVVKGSPSRGAAIFASQKRLALLLLVVHGVPLLLLGLWALVQWDRVGETRRPGSR